MCDPSKSIVIWEGIGRALSSVFLKKGPLIFLDTGNGMFWILDVTVWRLEHPLKESSIEVPWLGEARVNRPAPVASGPLF